MACSGQVAYQQVAGCHLQGWSQCHSYNPWKNSSESVLSFRRWQGPLPKPGYKDMGPGLIKLTFVKHSPFHLAAASVCGPVTDCTCLPSRAFGRGSFIPLPLAVVPHSQQVTSTSAVHLTKPALAQRPVIFPRS